MPKDIEWRIGRATCPYPGLDSRTCLLPEDVKPGATVIVDTFVMQVMEVRADLRAVWLVELNTVKMFEYKPA